MAALSARVGSIGDNHLGGWYAYRAAKSALNMIIRCTSIEIKRNNNNAIIIGLHPGTVDTNLSKPFQGHVPDQKLFTPEYSTGKMLEVINSVSTEDSGHVFAYDGEKLPY
jgi:NAD(P)-dependent dehydrogenase (short-subunit alcohol dehydrogenase family)